MAYDYRKDYAAYQREQRKKNAKYSLCLLFAFLLGLVYLIFLLCITYMDVPFLAKVTQTLTDALGTLGKQIMVYPHMIATLLAVIFTGFAFGRKSRKLALAGAVLYTVALVVYPGYFMFVIVEALLAYIGFARTP